MAGALTFGVLVAFMEYTHRFFLPIRDVSAKYTVMQSAMVAAERIFGLLDTQVEIRTPTAAYRPGRSTSDGATRRPAAIEFRDVWFAYDARMAAGDPPPRRPGGSRGPAGRAGRTPKGRRPSNSRRPSALPASRQLGLPLLQEDGWALRGLSLRIEHGERVALVGPTGAGKSTLARLLTRTYEVQRGAVLVEGVDVRESDLEELRRHVSLVLQDVVVFAGTIEENLTLGRAGVTRTEVEDAARRAHIDAFVRTLPAQYAEPIRERGANLSHGQRRSWPSPGPWYIIPPYWCWTRRRPASTRRPSASCRTPGSALADHEPDHRPPIHHHPAG